MKKLCSSSSTPRHKVTMLGLFITIGIVYGDIGTSPLYVMRAIVGSVATPSADYIIGALSCIIWTITLQATLKYVIIALQADNNGEGGILALYALVRRLRKKWLYIVSIIGAGTLVADGVITPAMTVVSAIEGLQTIDETIPVVPISITIIAVLFFVQQFGTKAIGRSFGPIMLIWFLTIGILGACHIYEYPAVLKAFNPYYAIHLLVTSPEWFLIMGAVFLCTTGAEALYSDLGHCGKGNIRITWTFVKLMLIINYLGQGAWTISHIGTLTPNVNPFYAVMPQWFIVPGVILATMAAVIASQALITGAFTIFSEAMNLNFWPQQKIKYTSDIKGQTYIPFINLFLFIFCLITILFFRDSSHMEAAYGLSITITMLMTTLLLTIYLNTKRVNRWLRLTFTILFLAIETTFLVANLFKFMHGGWYTIVLAGLIIVTMYIWYNARLLRTKYFVFRKISDYHSIIADIKNDSTIPFYANNLVYISRAERSDEVEGKIIYSIVNKQPKRANHYWFIHVHQVDEPSTLEYSVHVLIPDTLFRIDLKTGFRIHPYINLYFRQVIEDMVSEGRLNLTSCHPSLQRHGISGDFKFIVINRVSPHEESFNLHEKVIMNGYNIIKKIGVNDVNAYGLDTSNVCVENVPLFFGSPHSKLRIRKAQTGGKGSARWQPSPSTLATKAQHAGCKGSANGKA